MIWKCDDLRIDNVFNQRHSYFTITRSAPGGALLNSIFYLPNSVILIYRVLEELQVMAYNP